jgi:hypothetical protein
MSIFPRYSENIIETAIAHESVHRQHLRNWHDQEIAKAQSFEGTYSCKTCKRKKAEIELTLRSDWEAYYGGERRHSNPGWENNPPLPLEYSSKEKWYYGAAPRPLDGPFRDPLGEF